MNQYWLHYRLLDHWGYKALAKHWRKESIEEMEHADDLMVRIIFLRRVSRSMQLDPLHIGQTVTDILECDRWPSFEQAARASCTRKRQLAAMPSEITSAAMLCFSEYLMHAKGEHLDLLE